MAESRVISAVAVGLVALSLFASCVSAQVSQIEAAEAISEAEQAVALGYEAVLEAEAAGGDVATLLVELDAAAALVTDARRALGVDDFDGAKGLADQAASTGGGVWDNAKRLEVYTINLNSDRVMRSVIASCLAVPLVLVAGFLGYRYSKRRYYERLLKMKPEVGKA
jgi:hypothetical protein